MEGDRVLAAGTICEGLTGVAYDKASNRVFVGCSRLPLFSTPALKKWWRRSRTARSNT